MTKTKQNNLLSRNENKTKQKQNPPKTTNNNNNNKQTNEQTKQTKQRNNTENIVITTRVIICNYSSIYNSKVCDFNEAKYTGNEIFVSTFHLNTDTRISKY